MTKNLKVAEAYYMSIHNKKFDEMTSYLSKNVLFIGPLSTMDDREAVVEAGKKFSQFFTNITIREKFESGDKVVLIIDFECPQPIGAFSAASLISFDEELISSIELFYDARPFEQKKDEIFTNS